MPTFAEFLAFITELLGDDHALVTALTDANAAGEDDDARWGEVTDAQLGELRTELVTAAGDEDLDLAALEGIADRLEEVDALASQRLTTAEEEGEARTALLDRINGADGDGEDDGEGGEDDGDGEDDGEGGEDDGDGEDDGEGAEGENADEPEPVNAGAGRARRPNLGNVNARRPHGQRPSAEASTPAMPTVQLNDTYGGFARGAELSLEDFGGAMLQATRDFRGSHRGATQKIRVGTIRHETPEDRRLDGNTERNTQRIRDALADMRREMLSADDNGARLVALSAAAGGLCAPVTPYYPIQTLGDDATPVESFLASFQATRGGITFVPPPSFVDGDFADGVGVWTVDDDAAVEDEDFDPDVDGKPCAVLDCADPVTVVIEAITKCLEVSNMRAMTYPEQVEAAMHYLGMHHARTAETRRVNTIHAGSTAVPYTDGPIGAARLIARAVGTTSASLRDRFRMSDTETIDTLMPHWVPAAMVEDTAAAFSQYTTDEALAMAESVIARVFTRRNVRVGYFRDTQNFTASNRFPGSLTFYQFPPGTWLGLSDPDLDLGLVRDSALNKVNRFRYFAETFQNAAKLGVISQRVTIDDLCLSGAAAGTADPDAICDALSSS